AIDPLVEQVRKIAARYLKIREDLSNNVDDPKKLRRLLIENPIRALVNGPGTRDVPFFRFEKDRLSTTFNVGDVESFRELLREVLDWRLAQYLSQSDSQNLTADIICRVARNDDQPPFLLLPNSATALHLEQGPTPVQIGEQRFDAVVEKIAINVVRTP